MFEIAIAAYVAISLLATIIIVRSPHLERAQTVYQCCAIWLIPLVGALAILVFHSVVYTNMTTKPELYRGSNNSDDALTDGLHADLD
jgi:hypothetical protein